MKLYILAFLLLISCGARKVTKTETSETTKEKTTIDSTSKTNTIIQNNILTDECIIEPIDTNKVIEITDTFGKVTKYKNARLRHKKVNDNSIINIDNTMSKNVLKTSDKVIEVKTKEVDKKQFSISTMLLQLWWLWLLIIIAFLVYKKYKNSISFF